MLTGDSPSILRALEIDIFEANGAAIQTTVHTEKGTGPGACNECEYYEYSHTRFLDASRLSNPCSGPSDLVEHCVSRGLHGELGQQ